MTTDVTANTIAIATANERLRQERETFDQNKVHQARWFALRLRMGYAAAVMLPAIGAVSAVIILRPEVYSGTTIAGATVVLFTDLVGLLASVWKVVLNPSSTPTLSPVTSTRDVARKGKTTPEQPV
jgi:hypothetical protein